MADMINHPPHYTQGKYETLDIILDVTKHLPGNQAVLVGKVIKYMSRYHFKNGREDVEKARFYINKLLNLLEDEEMAKEALEAVRIKIDGVDIGDITTETVRAEVSI